MKVAVLLTCLAVARAGAAYFDEAVVGYDYAPLSPALTRAMFQKYGFAKPSLDAHFISFGRSMGASDPTILRLHSLYDEPAVLFFLDPTDGVVSYYADAGVNSALLSPELRSVFPSVLGASDSLAIVYQPESFLGSYKSVLPGHFFVPSHSHSLAKVLRGGVEALPLPVEHAIFKKSEIANIFPEVSPIYARFDIDEFPYAYKYPVTLSLFNADYSAGYPSSALYAKAFSGYSVPHSHPVFAKSAYPFFKSAYPYYENSFFKSGYPLIHSEISDYHQAYPLIRSDTSDYHHAYIPILKFPYAKHYAPYEPLIYPSYKIVHYPYHIAPIAPISVPIAAPIAAPAVEPAAPVDSELRGFPYYIRSFPGFYPSYPALRYPAPVYPAPIAPAAAGVAGASSAAKASASSMAGAAGVAPIF